MRWTKDEKVRTVNHTQKEAAEKQENSLGAPKMKEDFHNLK
jgi:hypothetical protein